MPLTTQAKLLRVLQNQEVLRVGSLTPRKLDLRVIAATNKDLRSAIVDRAFREDLYYRLTMIEIQIPPLKDRPEDLTLLIHHLIEKFSQQFGKPVRAITHRARIVLSRHDWPGNIRELENVIGHACMVVMGDTLDVVDLPSYLTQLPIAAAATARATDLRESGVPQSLEEQEKALVAEALQKSRGNQSEAARLLRIGRDALRYKMKKHNLT
jgi:transcriptional regulator with PAS, ATPase and Fis domain